MHARAPRSSPDTAHTFPVVIDRRHNSTAVPFAQSHSLKNHASRSTATTPTLHAPPAALFSRGFFWRPPPCPSCIDTRALHTRRPRPPTSFVASILDRVQLHRRLFTAAVSCTQHAPPGYPSPGTRCRSTVRNSNTSRTSPPSDIHLAPSLSILSRPGHDPAPLAEHRTATSSAAASHRHRASACVRCVYCPTDWANARWIHAGSARHSM